MSTAPDVRIGLARLAGWLDAHPDLPIHDVTQCEGEYAEISLDADGHPALEAVADVAAALTGVHITALDTPQSDPPVTDVTVSGYADTTDTDTRFEVAARVDAIYEIRTDLLARLGKPADPGSPEWVVTAELLREVADGCPGVTASA